MAIILPTAPTIPEAAADDIRQIIETAYNNINRLREVIDPDTYTPPSGFSPWSDATAYYTDYLTTLQDVGGITTGVDSYEGDTDSRRRFNTIKVTYTGTVDPVDPAYETVGDLNKEYPYNHYGDDGFATIAGLLTATLSGGSDTTWDGTTFTGPLASDDFRYNILREDKDEIPPNQVDAEFTAEELLTVKIIVAAVPEAGITPLTNALAALT